MSRFQYEFMDRLEALPGGHAISNTLLRNIVRVNQQRLSAVNTNYAKQLEELTARHVNRIDTLLVCSATAFMILSTGMYNVTDPEGGMLFEALPGVCRAGLGLRDDVLTGDRRRNGFALMRIQLVDAPLFHCAEDGRVQVCDPAAEPGEVLRSYPADAFSRAWLRHRGAAYILPP